MIWIFLLLSFSFALGTALLSVRFLLTYDKFDNEDATWICFFAGAWLPVNIVVDIHLWFYSLWLYSCYVKTIFR